MLAPKSQLQHAIDAFRLALRRAESMAVARTIDAYAPIRANLMTLVDDLANELTTTGTLTAGDVLKLQRAQELLAQIETQLGALGQAITPTIIDAQSAVVGAAVEQARREAILSALTDSASLAASVASSWNRLPVNALQSLIGALSDGSPLQAWMSQFGPQTAQAMAEKLTEGVALGLNPLNVAADLGTVLDVGGVRLAALARTSILSSYRSASVAQFRENADVLDGFIWVSAQDDSVCLSCVALDGTHFGLDETFAENHTNCRCGFRPSIRGVDSDVRPTTSDWFDSLPFFPDPANADAFGRPEPSQSGMLPKWAWTDIQNGALKLQDFTTVVKDRVWGDNYQQATQAQARANAAARTSQEQAA